MKPSIRNPQELCAAITFYGLLALLVWMVLQPAQFTLFITRIIP